MNVVWPGKRGKIEGFKEKLFQYVECHVWDAYGENYSEDIELYDQFVGDKKPRKLKTGNTQLLHLEVRPTNDEANPEIRKVLEQVLFRGVSIVKRGDLARLLIPHFEISPHKMYGDNFEKYGVKPIEFKRCEEVIEIGVRNDKGDIVRFDRAVGFYDKLREVEGCELVETGKFCVTL